MLYPLSHKLQHDFSTWRNSLYADSACIIVSLHRTKVGLFQQLLTLENLKAVQARPCYFNRPISSIFVLTGGGQWGCSIFRVLCISAFGALSQFPTCRQAWVHMGNKTTLIVTLAPEQ